MVILYMFSTQVSGVVVGTWEFLDQEEEDVLTRSTIEDCFRSS